MGRAVKVPPQEVRKPGEIEAPSRIYAYLLSLELIGVGGLLVLKFVF